MSKYWHKLNDLFAYLHFQMISKACKVGLEKNSYQLNMMDRIAFNKILQLVKRNGWLMFTLIFNINDSY